MAFAEDSEFMFAPRLFTPGLHEAMVRRAQERNNARLRADLGWCRPEDLDEQLWHPSSGTCIARHPELFSLGCAWAVSLSSM